MDIIKVEKRDGQAKAKQLRRAGIVPCCVYGGGLPESISIQMEQKTANLLLQRNREGSKVELELDGKRIPAQIKEKTRNFVDQSIEHIGFQALDSDHGLHRHLLTFQSCLFHRTLLQQILCLINLVIEIIQAAGHICSATLCILVIRSNAVNVPLQTVAAAL